MKTALVLGGGGARGAYEAGVVSFLRDELQPGLGRRLDLDILSGTSVGAINASVLASTASEPQAQGRVLTDRWIALQLHHVLSVQLGDIARIAGEFIGRPSARRHVNGGLVDPQGIRRIVLEGIRWSNIRRNLNAGALHALAVSATHVASGRTITFVQRHGTALPPWAPDSNVTAARAAIGPRHVLASAAIPMLFPPVRVGRALYADGGLRLSVPLSPALRLGARRVIVVSLRSQGPETTADPERAYATAPFLFGKTLNALLLDRTEQDLGRLRRINQMVAAGTDAFGPRFAEVLSAALVAHRSQPVRYVRNILVRPSRDISGLAADYARSATFRSRARGLSGRAMRYLADQDAQGSADMVSYLMFDGEFAARLIELGRSDARALGDEWARFFSEAPQTAAEAAHEAGADAGSGKKAG